MVVRLVGLNIESCVKWLEFLFWFAFLASMPGLYRKKCMACQHDNHFNSRKCKRYHVEVRSISNLLVDQGGLLPVRAMECQLFM